MDSNEFKIIVSEIQNSIGIKGKNLWTPIRIVITGKLRGPDIGSIVEIIGKEECIRRVQIQINE